MTEVLNRKSAELVLPPEADLPGLSVKDLHTLWRQNEDPLLQLASSFELTTLPALAVHGSAANRIQQLTQEDPMMWVFAACETVQDTNEFLRNLYCLASGSAAYSFFANEGRGNIKGQAGMMLFAVNSNKQFMTQEGKVRDSWATVANKHTYFRQTMPRSIRPPRPEETADYYGYIAEPLDSEEELQFFDFRSNPAKVIAFDRFIPEARDKRMPIFDDQTPKYLLRSVDQNPMVDSYRREILRRLFCQNLAATILTNLRDSGAIAEKADHLSEEAIAVDSLRSSVRLIKP